MEGSESQEDVVPGEVALEEVEEEGLCILTRILPFSGDASKETSRLPKVPA